MQSDITAENVYCHRITYCSVVYDQKTLVAMKQQNRKIMQFDITCIVHYMESLNIVKGYKNQLLTSNSIEIGAGIGV